MSNRLFQSVVHQMQPAIDRTIGVIDESLSIVACSDLGRIGESVPAVTAETFTVPENLRCATGRDFLPKRVCGGRAHPADAG